jgi:hypothetical protein
VKGIAIFALSLVSDEERRSYPLQVEQVVRSEAEKAAAKAGKEKKPAKQKQTKPKKLGRPKGSKNRDKTQVELTPELLRIQEMVKNQLAALQNLVTVHYLALDGHFGNNNALQMVRQCGLHLIPKLRHDARLDLPILVASEYALRSASLWMYGHALAGLEWPAYTAASQFHKSDRLHQIPGQANSGGLPQRSLAQSPNGLMNCSRKEYSIAILAVYYLSISFSKSLIILLISSSVKAIISSLRRPLFIAG